MRRKCNTCGMIRAQKDLVIFKDKTFMCFSCWNKYIRKKGKNQTDKSV